MIKFTLAIEVGDPDELGRWLGRVLAAAEQGVHDGKAKQGAPAPSGPPAAPGAVESNQQASVGPTRGKSEASVGHGAGVEGVRRADIPSGAVSAAPRPISNARDYSKVGNFRKLITAVQADGAKTVDEIFSVLQEVHAAGTCPVLRVIEADDLEDRVRSACELMGI